jgi:hypothetical protein
LKRSSAVALVVKKKWLDLLLAGKMNPDASCGLRTADLPILLACQ